jgi:hypothetical protein
MRAHGAFRYQYAAVALYRTGRGYPRALHGRLISDLVCWIAEITMLHLELGAAHGGVGGRLDAGRRRRHIPSDVVEN